MIGIIITALGASLVCGGLAGWVAFNIGYAGGYTEGRGDRYRDAMDQSARLRAMMAMMAAPETDRPQRGPDGRYVKRGA